EHGPAKLWLDAGNGTFAELQRLADFTGIDALVPSHVHADHWPDGFPRHVALRYGEHSGLRLPLYCPPGTRETLAPLLLEGGWEELGEAFLFHVVDAGDTAEIAGGPLSVL